MIFHPVTVIQANSIRKTALKHRTGINQTVPTFFQCLLRQNGSQVHKIHSHQRILSIFVVPEIEICSPFHMFTEEKLGDVKFSLIREQIHLDRIIQIHFVSR